MLKIKMNRIVTVLFVILILSSLIVCAEEKANPLYGGTLIVPAPYRGSFETLDPTRTSQTQNWIVTEQIFRGLVETDYTTSKPVPAIAESWDITKDGKEYVFQLRKGVKFHNGREVKAQDFKYSFERQSNPEEGVIYASNILSNVVGYDEFQKGESKEISGIKVLDDYTLQIYLKDLDSEFLYKLSEAGGCDVVPKEVVEKLGRDFEFKPVSAGPFKFVSWEGNEIVLEAFDDYYDGKPYLDKLVFKAIEESSSAQASFEAQEIDFSIVTIAQYQQYLKKNKEMIIEAPEFYTRLIGFNMECDLFKDKRVRQAINYAIDRKTVVEKYLRGKAYTATGYLPPNMPSYNPALKGYEYNPEKAKMLLKEAGYENGFDLEIIGKSNLSWGIPLVVAVMPYFEAVGIRIKPVQLESGVFVDKIQKGDYQAFTWSLGGYASPVTLIDRFVSWESREGGNAMAYNNSSFDSIMELIYKETNFEAKMNLLRAAEVIFVNDAPCWFFNYNKAVIVHQPWVHGLQPVGREMMFQPLDKVWVDKDSPRF